MAFETIGELVQRGVLSVNEAEEYAQLTIGPDGDTVDIASVQPSDFDNRVVSAEEIENDDRA